MYNSEKHFKSLELDKILMKASAFACCDKAKEAVLSLSPITDLSEVKKQMQKTSDAFSLSLRFGTPTFLNLKQPDEDINLCEAGATLTTKQLLNIASILRQIRILKEWYSHCEGIENSLSIDFMDIIPNKLLEDRISNAIISEDTISDHASDELYAIRRKIRQAENRIREQIEKIIKSQTYQKYLQDSIVTIRDGRFVVPVKSEHRNEVAGLVHDSSSSGATLFIEPMAVVEANNEIRVLQNKEQDEIERILADLSAQCAENAQQIKGGFEAVVQINVYFAKANFGAKYNGNIPKITDDGVIVLNKARHPLIDAKQVVPISLELGKEFTGLIVTGPNTGGKTVTLKTIGLLTLMTMCGFMIPVGDNSQISVFDKILVDIGDEQSIEHNLSTFSAHMKNIISIISACTARSLVLIDELGSGTDPIEGAALATSILEKIKQKGCIFATTTHYAELKIYALQTDGVQNASCEFDVETLKPTYKLIMGAPGRSNAFAISSKLGLDGSIIENAKQLITTENKRFEDVIESLEQSRIEFEKQSAQLKANNKEVERLKKEILESNDELFKKRETEIERARQKARNIVESVQAQALAMMNELEKLKKEKDKQEFSSRVSQAKSQLKSKLNEMYDTADPITAKKDDNYVLPRPLVPGDTVNVVDIDKKGTVLTKPDKSGNVQVQVGIIKMRVKLDNLRLLKQEKTKFMGKSTTKNVRNNATKQIKTELDLRGFTVEEALMEADLFIDDCVLSNVSMLSIIHGKGTGALRTAIHQHLRKHPSVRSFRLGVYGEGETGVTIVELK